MTEQDRARKINRFMSRVNKTPTCWLWTWKLNDQGYGSFYLSQKYKGGAHRAAYVLFKREEIPDDMVVRHKCDNPSCVNPDHLELGTQLDNCQDCIQRGRFNPPKKLEYCKKGLHKMTEDNIAYRDTVWKTTGRRWRGRQCRACHIIAARKSYERKKARLSAAPEVDANE